MNNSKAIEIIKKFKDKKIAVIGDIMLDHFVWGNSDRISPEAPVPVVNFGHETYMPGGSGNASRNIKSLGGEVELIGLIGEDEAGVKLLKILDEASINTKGIIKNSQYNTIQKIRIISANQHVVRIDKEKKWTLTNLDEDRVINYIEANIANWEIVLVSDYNKGFLTERIAKRIVELCNEKDVLLVVDAKPDNFHYYKNCYLIKPNAKEAVKYTNINDVIQAGEALKNDLKCNVLITQGADGMTLFENDSNRTKHIQARSGEVYDVSGAGDTVAAALALGLASGCSLEESVELSNYAAAIVVGKVGTAVVEHEEFIDSFRSGSKIKNIDELLHVCDDLRNKKKKIVAINGSFDILHVEHIDYLHEAKSLGDVLIILLNSDKSIKKYKGSTRPINSEKERSKVLSAFEVIDYIYIFDEINPKLVLEKIKPDILYQGSEWGKNCVERNLVESYGGEIYVRPKKEFGVSSSNIIKRIIDSHSQPIMKAVFLDRDGTININEPEYTHKIEDFKFFPGAIEALRELSKTDYKIIIASNQSGIGRGYFEEKDLANLHKWMLEEFRKEKIRIDKIYYCPHHPDEKCQCRKPNIGMFLKAVEDLGISLSKSWIIGDDAKDVIAGREANLQTIKIGEKMPADLKLEPHYYTKNLKTAIDLILNS